MAPTVVVQHLPIKQHGKVSVAYHYHQHVYLMDSKVPFGTVKSRSFLSLGSKLSKSIATQ